MKKSETIFLVATLAGALALAIFAPSNQSLWIDEGISANYFNQSDLHQVALSFLQDRSSERQMPGFILTWWSANRIFGNSEWALRAPNIAFAWLAIFFMWFAGKLARAPATALLLIASPFLWYYMDEARPYVMQIAGGAASAYALVRLVILNRLDWRFAISWTTGAILMGAASMLGGFCLLAATLTAIVVGIRSRVQLQLRPLLFTCGGYLFMTGLGVYYGWTILEGAGGAKMWALSIGNIGFAVYELLGFVGLGPGRLALREAGRAGIGQAIDALLPFAPLIVALGITFAVVAFLVIRCNGRVVRRILLANGAVIGLGGGFLVVAAYLAQWPFWGRHFAPFLPFLVVGISVGIQLADVPRRVRHVALGGLLVLWTLSSFNIRFLDVHLKDQYREAAVIAASDLEAGKNVWWVADTATAEYYLLPYSESPARGKAINLYMPDARTLDELPPPDTIILSRPDQFDVRGSVADYINQNRYQKAVTLVGFTVWLRSGMLPTEGDSQ